MDLKEFWSKTNRWLGAHKLSESDDYQPELDTENLIAVQGVSAEETESEEVVENNQVVVKTVSQENQPIPAEKLQHGFEQLIEQLQGINENLNSQVTQHQSLMIQLEKMPNLLESFPAVVQEQQELAGQLIEQLKAKAANDQQFTEAVEKIPNETSKQTDALVSINHQLAASADTDVQVVENFNKFNKHLEQLDRSAGSQTDSILQMSKTFATSDRYLKYLISKQNKRFMWMFIVAMGVCVFAILLLTGIIFFLPK